MTDYLEQAMEGNAEALRDEQRRLESALTAQTGGDRTPGTAQEAQVFSALSGTEADEQHRSAATAEAELPLLEQTLRAERLNGNLPAPAAAQAVGEERQAVGRTGGFRAPEYRTARRPGMFDTAEDQTGRDRLSAVSSVGGGHGQNWAEQVDRAFRRDSRRYDGGFFLY